MDYYWEIIQFDGTRTEIPPEAVPVVKRRWENGQPIHTTNESIPANQIKTFRKTAKPYGQQPLLEAVAAAFDDPVITEDGSIKARWVKKTVSQAEWKKLGGTGAYRKLADDGGLIVVGFMLPVHQIDLQIVDYCTEQEIQQLTR